MKKVELIIPKKQKESGQKVNVQCRISSEKNERFENVKKVLGGYSTQELMEIMIDQLISTYDEEETVNEV